MMSPTALVSEVAKRFGVSLSAAYLWVKEAAPTPTAPAFPRRQMGPKIESEAEFLAAWEPAAELDPKHQLTLLELIDAIENDYNALDAFARIAAEHPPFDAQCIERLVARVQRRVLGTSTSSRNEDHSQATQPLRSVRG
jgi:hypothetical protein